MRFLYVVGHLLYISAAFPVSLPVKCSRVAAKNKQLYRVAEHPCLIADVLALTISAHTTSSSVMQGAECDADR